MYKSWQTTWPRTKTILMCWYIASAQEPLINSMSCQALGYCSGGDETPDIDAEAENTAGGLQCAPRGGRTWDQVTGHCSAPAMER